jgi:hypothetical protein
MAAAQPASPSLRDSPIAPAAIEDFAKLDDETRTAYLTSIAGDIKNATEKLVEQANLSNNASVHRRNYYSSIRLTIFILSLILTILNVLISSWPETLPEGWPTYLGRTQVLVVLPFITAIYAAFVGALQQFVSPDRYLSESHRNRIQRDELYATAQEWNTLWKVAVEPLGLRPEACRNAALLLQQVNADEARLRRQFQELSKQPSAQPSPGDTQGKP